MSPNRGPQFSQDTDEIFAHRFRQLLYIFQHLGRGLHIHISKGNSLDQLVLLWTHNSLQTSPLVPWNQLVLLVSLALSNKILNRKQNSFLRFRFTLFPNNYITKANDIGFLLLNYLQALQSLIRSYCKQLSWHLDSRYWQANSSNINVSAFAISAV